MKLATFPITTEAIISFEDSNDRRLVLLFKTFNPSNSEEWQLPTTDLRNGETALDAVQRMVREKVNLNIDKGHFDFLNMYDDPSRIRDGKRVVSVTYFHFLEDVTSILTAKSNFLIKKKGWFDVDNLPVMAFDHGKIIREFIEQQYPLHYSFDK